ncbi:MAG: tetratricopeptide repeat protein [Treponemataceae bacterium]
MKRPSPIIVFSLLVLVSSALPLFAQDKPDALKTYRQGRDFEAQGRTADANDRYETAIKICKDEITQNVANMDSYAVLTWTYIRQRKYQDTIEWGLKGLKVNQSDYRVTESLGEAYFYIEDYKESLRYMQKYVDSAPQGERVSVAYFFMGEIYRIQRKFKHADIAYTTAVKMEPSLALWWYRLGTAREQTAEYASATSAFEKAVSLNPSYKDASEALERVKKRVH